MINLNLSSKIAEQHSKLTNFFHIPIEAPSAPADVITKNIAKDSLRRTGSTVNNQIYKIGSKLGNQLSSLLTQTEGFAGYTGKVLSKIPGIKTFANNLSGIGTDSTKRIPGLGTLLLLADTVIGTSIAIKRVFQGDGQGAGHQILKTTGSFIGSAAGLAIAATGIGVIPGLLIATATGLAGNYIGKKAADILFPKVKERENIPQELKKQKIYF